jgi:hypothetical protein
MAWVDRTPYVRPWPEEQRWRSDWHLYEYARKSLEATPDVIVHFDMFDYAEVEAAKAHLGPELSKRCRFTWVAGRAGGR